MLCRNVLIATAVTLIASPSFGAVSPKDIQGQWRCDPYTMNGPGMTITVVEQRLYSKDGSYFESSTSSTKLNGGRVITTKSNISGSWQLNEGIIELQFKSTAFLSSDDKDYSLEMGQRDADAQLQRKNWAKEKVLEFGKRLVTTPVQAMYKAAEVIVSCRRA